MNDGPELDALVAEKVMGLSNVRLARGTSSIYLYDREPDDPHEVPRYSTDMAAAWLVAENLMTTGDLDILGHRHPVTWFVEYIHGGGFGEPRTHSRLIGSSTAPHAICLAALSACRVVVPA